MVVSSRARVPLKGCVGPLALRWSSWVVGRLGWARVCALEAVVILGFGVIGYCTLQDVRWDPG